MVDTKICLKCGATRPLKEYSKNTKYRDGLRDWCNRCCSLRDKENKLNIGQENEIRQKIIDKANTYKLNHRHSKNIYLLRTYGITFDQYTEMIVTQGGKCAICDDELDIKVNTYVDHCHETGKVRGILCPRCNFALGCFMDSTVLLWHAIEYLRGNR